MAAGRPSSYDPKFCDIVIECGKEGKSVVQMACACNVVRNTMETEWTKNHPEFLEAFNLAKQLSQQWWEAKGQECLIMPQGMTFQGSVWSRSMAARFPHDWREQSKVENTHSAPDGGAIKNETVIRIVRPPPKDA